MWVCGPETSPLSGRGPPADVFLSEPHGGLQRCPTRQVEARRSHRVVWSCPGVAWVLVMRVAVVPGPPLSLGPWSCPPTSCCAGEGPGWGGGLTYPAGAWRRSASQQETLLVGEQPGSFFSLWCLTAHPPGSRRAVQGQAWPLPLFSVAVPTGRAPGPPTS